MIAKSSRPFTEGLFVKECLMKASEILCPDRKKVFEGISLSANTVACRITDLADNVQKQLIQISKDFEAFSIALDEHTDVSDTAQYAVFIRGVDCNLNITEELLDLMPLKGTTTGRDIFQGLEECIEKAALQWNKLVSLATDSAPSMCSENVGVVGLLKTKLNSLNIPGISFTSIHCILHQEALCSKSLQMKEVMDVVVKTVKFIRARGLNHRQFTSFLANMDSEYGELLYHTQVRWLSRGNVLKRYFALREEIDSFMKMKNKEVPQLADSTFICSLAFLYT
ncbi:GTF2I repeat domain containing 2B [Chelydra serpentina]|uniref:GTF2I repeat domain containing 2B n=1 Tax=Chelydra serpentina TaxID=8475 RepID=A0A8T1S0F9_CHESE|nr:GTF2I repeat domain containing 2B [Chelydra serpentina]